MDSDRFIVMGETAFAYSRELNSLARARLIELVPAVERDPTGTTLSNEDYLAYTEALDDPIYVALYTAQTRFSVASSALRKLTRLVDK